MHLAPRRRSEACPSWPWCCSAWRWRVRAARPAGPPAGQTGAVMKTTTIGGTTVLTNGQGFTLYWFAPDTPARSACNGACAQYWPPVTAGRRPPPAGGQARRHRAVGRDHPVRRLDAGHLRPASAVHLCRRHRPRANQWQQPQLERWPVARSHHDPISPRQNTVATPALIPDGGSSSACPGVTLIRRRVVPPGPAPHGRPAALGS